MFRYIFHNFFVWKSVLTIPYDYIIQSISQITKRKIQVILSSFLNICCSSIFLSYYLLILSLYSFTCIECEDWPSTNCKLKQQCIFLKKKSFRIYIFPDPLLNKTKHAVRINAIHLILFWEKTIFSTIRVSCMSSGGNAM